jgi:hypothetical protein
LEPLAEVGRRLSQGALRHRVVPEELPEGPRLGPSRSKGPFEVDTKSLTAIGEQLKVELAVQGIEAARLNTFCRGLQPSGEASHLVGKEAAGSCRPATVRSINYHLGLPPAISIGTADEG